MAEFDADNWPEFIELPGFSRAWASLGLSDDDLTTLQAAILDGPNCHPVVSGTGGLRKIRFARPGKGRGKSSSYRVCRGTPSDHRAIEGSNSVKHPIAKARGLPE